jgi:hypothetical protein
MMIIINSFEDNTINGIFVVCLSSPAFKPTLWLHCQEIQRQKKTNNKMTLLPKEPMAIQTNKER